MSVLYHPCEHAKQPKKRAAKRKKHKNIPAISLSQLCFFGAVRPFCLLGLLVLFIYRRLPHTSSMHSIHLLYTYTRVYHHTNIYLYHILYYYQQTSSWTWLISSPTTSQRDRLQSALCLPSLTSSTPLTHIHPVCLHLLYIYHIYLYLTNNTM